MEKKMEVYHQFETKVLRERLASLLQSRKDLVAFIRGVPEISRPLALELIGFARQYVLMQGGVWEEDVQVLHVSREYVALALKVKIRIGEGRLEIVEVGECSKEENAGDALARVAFTRAIKRALESLVGEDFINRILLQVIGTENNGEEKLIPATENQKSYLRNLISQGRINQSTLESAKERSLVHRGFVLEDESTWDKKSVSNLIDMVRGRR